MCGKIPDKPCGWPEGTIRSLIAVPSILMTVGVTGALAIMFGVNNQISSTMSTLGVMSGLIGVMLGFYFGSRSAENSSKIVADAHNNLLQATLASNERNLQIFRTLQNFNHQDEIV